MTKIWNVRCIFSCWSATKVRQSRIKKNNNQATRKDWWSRLACAFREMHLSFTVTSHCSYLKKKNQSLWMKLWLKERQFRELTLHHHHQKSWCSATEQGQSNAQKNSSVHRKIRNCFLFFFLSLLGINIWKEVKKTTNDIQNCD